MKIKIDDSEKSFLYDIKLLDNVYFVENQRRSLSNISNFKIPIDWMMEKYPNVESFKVMFPIGDFVTINIITKDDFYDYKIEQYLINKHQDKLEILNYDNFEHYGIKETMLESIDMVFINDKDDLDDFLDDFGDYEIDNYKQ